MAILLFSLRVSAEEKKRDVDEPVTRPEGAPQWSVDAEFAKLSPWQRKFQHNAISRELDELPFQRYLDLQAGIVGVPDFLALLVEFHPLNQLGIAAGGGVVAVPFLGSDIPLASFYGLVSYRWDVTMDQYLLNRSMHQTAIGPALGVHCLALSVDASGDRLHFSDYRWKYLLALDVLVSVEYTVWEKAHVGISFQVDAGLEYVLPVLDATLVHKSWQENFYPLLRITVGLAV